MSARRRRALVALASLAATLALLALAEGVARLAWPEPPRQREEAEFIARSLDYLQPCFRHDGGSLVETNAGLPPPRRGRSIPRARTPGVARVAVVGESSASLLAQSLDAALARSPCGRRYELLDCAVPGSGLEHLERRFDEVMRESPDVVVVTFGHNLRFILPTDEGRLRARLLRFRSRLLARLGALVDPPAPRSSNAPLAERLPRFEAFLARASREARARRVGLVVTTMASNLWMPPSSAPDDRASPRLADARYAEAAAGPAEAARALAPAPGDAPAVDFERGVLIARAGDGGAAREHLHRALAGDSFATRAPDAVNDAIRRAAAAGGFALRDTARAIEDAAPLRLPGWESFQDNCHLAPAAIDREAAGVFAAARPALGLPASCELGPGDGGHRGGDLGSLLRQLRGYPPDQAGVWYEAVALRTERRLLDDAGAASAEAAGYLRDERSPAPEALAALAEGSWRAGREGEARELNARAREAGGAGAWVQLGLFELRRRAPEAARGAWQRALAIDGGRADARRFLERLGAPP